MNTVENLPEIALTEKKIHVETTTTKHVRIEIRIAKFWSRIRYPVSTKKSEHKIAHIIILRFAAKQ